MLKLVSQNELTASIRLAVDELAPTGTEYDLFAALPNGCSELLLSIVVDKEGKIAFRTYEVDNPEYVSVAKNGKLAYVDGARR